jgi:hypothetical protein
MRFWALRYTFGLEERHSRLVYGLDWAGPLSRKGPYIGSFS